MSDLLSKCDVCQALIDEEDLFCANCGTEAPQRETSTPAPARLSTHNFECSGCGASMSFDASAGRLRCPFCGSQRLDQKQSGKVLAPRRVVPFRLSRDDAVAKMRAWLGNGFWRPSNLSQEALIVEMTPVYVPYWVFEASTHTYWTADSSQTPYGARGNWYPMTGEHYGEHAGLLIGASGALTPADTSAICPFDLADGMPPEQVNLDNVTVEQFSVPRKYARPQARHGVQSIEAQTCRQRYVPGKARNVKVNVRIEGLASEPVLLPVWIMAYRFRNQVFRFLLNGQTGKSTGTAPFSYHKLAMIIGIALAALLLLFCLIGLAGR